ncbi:hypothetical protein [Mesorhizobium sp.]|uniref:hypothetical protein n=1 Tax=Mesorhizobium sp. TaxID=1871066 RepID=UPI0011FF8443|nr:hypothetical protein [Mesorhizobium sp.]TIO78572.1 MAG: hypothetical protein E5X75_05390 [Mesorhizobium sp.]
MGASASINFSRLQSALFTFLLFLLLDELVRRLTNCSVPEGFDISAKRLNVYWTRREISYGIAD